MTSSPGQGHQKWYKMEAVNGAYKWAVWKILVEKFACIFQSEVFAMQDGWIRAGWLARRTQLVT